MNARSALIDLYCRDVEHIWSTVGRASLREQIFFNSATNSSKYRSESENTKAYNGRKNDAPRLH